MHFIARVADRLVPALLLAGGVTLLMAGLLSFAPPTLGDPQAPPGSPGAGDPALTPDVSQPTQSPTAAPSLSPRDPVYPPYLPGSTPYSPTEEPFPSIRPSSPLPGEATPLPGSTIPADGRPTRIAIPSLRIDLPIVPGDLIVPRNPDFYPLCDVAQYMKEFADPGGEGSTYVYAHAQSGMFLPMLRASLRDGGAEMIGALIEVYTSDARLHLYEIFRVKRHATDLSLANNVEEGEHRLVLQTSEGPEGTVPKLQLAARPIGVVPATVAEAMPPPEPRVCAPR